jgi:hypothetical protein
MSEKELSSGLPFHGTGNPELVLMVSEFRSSRRLSNSGSSGVSALSSRSSIVVSSKAAGARLRSADNAAYRAIDHFPKTRGEAALSMD